MGDPTKQDLSAISDEILEAMAGGSMSENEAKWLLDNAAEMKQKGYTKERLVDYFYNTHVLAHRDDVSWQEIDNLLTAEWDNI